MTERDAEDTNGQEQADFLPTSEADLGDLEALYQLLSQEELLLMNRAAEELHIDLGGGARDIAPPDPDPEYEPPV